MSTGWLLTAYCAAILLASMGGGWLPLGLRPTHIRLQTYLSFASGAMLGAAICHMMPYASEKAGGTWFYWMLGGVLSLIFLERFLAFHHHEAESDEPAHEGHGHHEHSGESHAHEPGAVAEPTHSRLAWRTALLGLSVHTLTGGFALASAVAADAANDDKTKTLGFSVFLATLLHKPADSLTITSLMVSEGMSARASHVINFCFALLIPLGAVVFFVFSGSAAWSPDTYVGGALAFSAGTFLSIALGDLLPELQFHRHDRVQLSTALLAGVGLMVLSAWLE
jgi:zinc and cadmium transporter